MIIEKIEGEGFFSFGAGDDRFELNLNSGLNVIVGPNGVGKTNVLRLIELVRTAVAYQDPKWPNRSALRKSLDDYLAFGRREGMDAASSSDVRFTLAFSDGDKTLMTSFIQAVVMAALLDHKVPDSPTLAAVEKWVATEVTAERLKSLYRGTIAVSHSGVPGEEWQVAYEFNHAGRTFVWYLQTSSPNRLHVIEEKASDSSRAVSLGRLVRRLYAGSEPGSTDTPRLSEASFSIETLLGDDGDLVQVVATAIHGGHLPAPLRTFAGCAVPLLPRDYITAQQSSLSLASALSVILGTGLRYPIGGDGTDSLVEPTPDNTLRRALDHLFGLKTGSWIAQALYRDVQNRFTELAPGRRFDLRAEEVTVAEGVSTVVVAEVFPNDGATLPTAVRPLRLAGRGVEQALLLAAALVTAADQVLILDEPATYLHPAWQRIVRSSLIASRSQCILVTHSPYLLPAEDNAQLTTVARLSAPAGSTRLHRLFAAQEEQSWVDTLTKELAWSADARALLFANGVVLLEGETELGALPIWFAKSSAASRYGSPEDLQIGFYSVGGDQGFGTFVRYLDRFGVPWAIVCDGAAFRFDKGRHIFEQVGAAARESGLGGFWETKVRGVAPSGMTELRFREMTEVARLHGVFTLASGWHTKPSKKRCGSADQIEPEPPDDESFEAYIASDSKLDAAFSVARRSAPKSKPRAGRLLAESVECPEAVSVLYGQIVERLGLASE